MNEFHFCIGIPTYSRLGYLKIAVQSALEQTFQDFQILISLDSGPQGHDARIVHYLKDISQRHSNIKFHLTEKNLGLAGNWNRIAQLSQGRYTVLMGDDDVLEPSFLEKLKEGTDREADVVFGNQLFIDSDGHPLDSNPNEIYHRNELARGFLPNTQRAIWRNSIPMSSSVIKTSCLREFQFKEDLNTPEIELFLRMELERKKFYFVPEPIMLYRVHPLSATASGLKVHLLFNYLAKIPVSVENAIYKEHFLKNLAHTAASRFLKSGEKSKAKEIMKSPFYPKLHWKLVYHILFFLTPSHFFKK